MKPWYRSRTIWTQIAVGTLGALAELQPQIRELLPTHLGGWLVVGVAVANVWLRIVTTQPVGRP